jgi:hypothetical protein
MLVRKMLKSSTQFKLPLVVMASEDQFDTMIRMKIAVQSQVPNYSIGIGHFATEQYHCFISFSIAGCMTAVPFTQPRSLTRDILSMNVTDKHQVIVAKNQARIEAAARLSAIKSGVAPPVKMEFVAHVLQTVGGTIPETIGRDRLKELVLYIDNNIAHVPPALLNQNFPGYSSVNTYVKDQIAAGNGVNKFGPRIVQIYNYVKSKTDYTHTKKKKKKSNSTSRLNANAQRLEALLDIGPAERVAASAPSRFAPNTAAKHAAIVEEPEESSAEDIEDW